jgi:DnaJ-class molecular chaperone
MFEMFGQRRGPNQEFQRRTHARMSLWIRLADVAQGGRRPVALSSPNGSNTVEIDIPLGINDGDNVQYAGIAPGGQDLVVQFRIHPDPHWQRDGLDLLAEISVPVWDLIAGGEVTVTDILGNKLIAVIPARTQTRTMLRLRGKGLRDRAGNQGDILVKLHAKIPDTIHPDILDAIQKHHK